MRPFTEPADLEEAVEARDVEVSTRLIQKMTGWRIKASAMDEDDDVLYFAVDEEGMVKGYAAFLDEENNLVCIPESDSPMFVGAPFEVIRELSNTLNVNAIRWRRDSLVFDRRAQIINVSDLNPPWTTYYSEAPLAQLGNPAHIAIITSMNPVGNIPVVVTDGIRTQNIELSFKALDSLIPLWNLEWTVAPHTIMAAKGRSKLRFMTLGLAMFKVGMMFNETGGLISWSPAATHCELMAAICKQEDGGFTGHELHQQLKILTESRR